MPAEFFSSIDVLIVPSLWPDPAPYVVVEALSAGKSLICANSGGIPELARLGLKVKLYPPASVVALTEAMSTCLCNPSSWREGGFQHPQSAKAFGEQEIVAQHLNWYLPQS
jgi:glycosyltransferase involved in cell wall biosynthesis